MNKQELASKITETAERVKYHSDLYYNKSTPELTDAEYDAMVDDLKGLVEQLECLDPTAPEVSLGKEVLNDVGSAPSYGKKVEHKYVMGSLEKATSVAEVLEWYNKYSPAGGCKICVTPKMDGCAGRFNFSNGMLVQAATRGDGKIGQDVTDNILATKSFPKTCSFKDIEIRGEVLMSRATFKKMSESGERVFANPRNAGTGSLMAQDPKVTGSRNLQVMCYDVVGAPTTFKTERDKRAWEVANLTEFAFVEMMVIDIEQFASLALEWESKRPTLDFEIDGLVLALDDIEAQEEAGWNGNRPRGKIAFKFKPEQQISQVNSIDFQVGRTGRLTPMARIKPTTVAGSMVSNITLHNMANIQTLQLNVGDDILIQKAGDIIPEVVRVYQKKSVGVFDIPKVCPSCGGAVEWDDNMVTLWCHNTNCPAQIERNILHWAKTLDIIGVGTGVCRALCDAGYVKEITDLYFLTEEQLVSVTGGVSSANKIQMSILGKNDIPLATFLDGLGIDGLGTTASKLLAGEFKTLAAIRNANECQFSGISSIGSKTAKNIVEGLKKQSDMIDKLVTIIDVQDVVVKQGALSGMSFVLTGAMSKPRKMIEQAIEAAGGENKGSVSKGVTYLVASDPNSGSSKNVKAQKLGIKVIGEEDLWSMIG